MKEALNKRMVGILILLAVVIFYASATGFPFFYRLLYVVGLALVLGLGWAWINLQGLEVRLSRLAHRGQVGDYLEGRIQVVNRLRLPKSWLEVTEVTDLPEHGAGRGIALVRDQSRSWRIETYLARRGVYQTGRIQVTSQDPFGLFRLSRTFLEPQSYVVFPAIEPLPDFNPLVAFRPSDLRTARRSDQITPQSSGVREYVYGDSFRQIHWPYTARMNQLMVKEFDIGLSAASWVLLDMQRSVQLGDDPVDNTGELTVTIAAALVNRISQLGLPAGLAANGDQTWLLRPSVSPAHLGILMEALAAVQARGNVTLERFIYNLQPQLSQFNTLTVITASRRAEWIPALSSLRREGVNVSVVYIDPSEFGAVVAGQSPLDFLFSHGIPVYLVKRGQSLNEALRTPLYGEPHHYLDWDSRARDGSSPAYQPASSTAQYSYQASENQASGQASLAIGSQISDARADGALGSTVGPTAAGASVPTSTPTASQVVGPTVAGEAEG